MTTLPSLPLIDGALFVDNSMLELLTTCPRALQYNRFERRIAAVSKPSLSFGSAVHLALEHRYKTYKNLTPDAVLDSEVSDLLTKFFEENPVGEDYRNLNWAQKIVKKYNEKYDIEPFQLMVGPDGQPLVELSFALPLFTHYIYHPEGADLCDPIAVPVIYTGRIDLPVLWDSQLFIIDHKTTSMIGQQFFDKMKMSAQQKGYCWAFEQLTGKKVHGYCINAIRVKEPPLSLGKEGGRTKQTEATWWNDSFQRERYFLQPGEMEEWKTNCIALIEEMFYHYQKGLLPMKTAWCSQFGRCQYYDVCSLPASDRNLMLESGMFTENLWNPLKTPTNAKQ